MFRNFYINVCIKFHSFRHIRHAKEVSNQWSPCSCIYAENCTAFLLTVASEQLPSGVPDFRLSAIELSEWNRRSFSWISTESARYAVHDIQPRWLQVCAQDTLRGGQRKTSWKIVRQTELRLLRVARSKCFHGVRFVPRKSIQW